MGKCVVCGKGNIFSLINAAGRCTDCEIAYRKEQRKLKAISPEASSIYNSLVSLFSQIQEDITYEDKNTYSDVFPIIKNRIRTCERIQTLLEDCTYEASLAILLETKLVYKNEIDKMRNRAFLDDFSLSIPISDNGLVNSFCQCLQTNITFQLRRLKNLENTYTQYKTFNSALSSIEHCPIEHFAPVERLEALDTEIKYSNITAKTNFEQLGYFVAIDVETTGLKHIKDRIIEVSAIKFENWEPVKCFCTLLNPGINIPREITEHTGISTSMVETSPSFEEIVPGLSEFIGASNLVGHNLDFDLRFLYAGGYNFLASKRKYYDTLAISRNIIKQDYIDNYKLITLCDYFSIRDNTSAHRATSDCLATGLLLHHLAKEKM